MRRRDFLRTTLRAGALLGAVGSLGNAEPDPKTPAGRAAAPLRSPDRLVPAASPILADSRLAELAQEALDAARAAGAGFADVRISRIRHQRVTAREQSLTGLSDSESFGFGVRALVRGTWGFAASSDLTRDEVRRVAALAAATARANAPLRREPVRLAPVRVVRDVWQTPHAKDPFRIPLGRKVDLLLAANREALKVAGVKSCTSFLHFVGEEKIFASTEGSLIEQRLIRSNPGCTVTAVDPKTGKFESRAHDVPPASLGYEHVEQARLVEEAPRLAEEAVRRLRARPVQPGSKDLVLHPSNLWLTIHESVGHPTELDRALGYEANFAGTSFLTPEKLGTFRFGSPGVYIEADRTMPGGLATVGYDDEGVPADRWLLVREGIFVDYQTTREQARWIGRKQSRGCSHSDSWGSVPFQRMPNVSLLAGESSAGLEELLDGVRDGVYVEGRGSYSIDQQRYNFQFSGQSFREIRNGKLGEPLRDVAYQASTPDFWNSCDALGGKETWQAYGTFYDGKGEPGQVNAVSHGCPLARFRKITILNTGGAS